MRAMKTERQQPSSAPGIPHPRTIGWVGTTALAMGGSNQSLFLIGGATGLLATQGSAAVPLLIVGLVLSWAAAFGWTELILLWPNRVGGIAATCAEAFRPYSPVLANLCGVCYWWGWVPTCGLTALLSATAIHAWYLASVPIPLLASLIVIIFTGVNLCGVRWVARLAIPIATVSAALALVSGLVPLLSGHVNWAQATTYHLITPFPGVFGNLSSTMAGLYLIGFAAPAFEAAACHVGETVDPARNVPRAMFASGATASLYFVVLPVLWLGTLGTIPFLRDVNVATALGPTFMPLFGTAAHAAALWFITFNMFHGTLQPLAGASRTLMQLAEDGLLPRILGWRSRTDVPWVATLLTAAIAIVFLLTGDPVWVVAAANLAYLIGICLPSVAVWLLRRDAPQLARPYRAPRGTIGLGLVAAAVWGMATIFGFEQFGLPTVLGGVALSCSGPLLYVVRRWINQPDMWTLRSAHSLHVKLTGAMLVVLTLDGTGYYLAISSVSKDQVGLIAGLEDIFVAVALLIVSVGLVLPGMIAHAAGEVARGAERLATGPLAEFSRAMQALSVGNLEAAHAQADVEPVVVYTRDEVGAMATSFNTMQVEVAQAVQSLRGAREGLQRARDALRASNAELTRAAAELEQRVEERTMALQAARAEAVAHANRLGAIFEAIADGVVVCDAGGHLLQTNHAAWMLLAHEGTDGPDAGPQNHDRWQEALRDESGQPLDADALPLSRILRGDVLTGLDVVDAVLSAPDRTDRHLNMSGAPVRDGDGHITGGVLVIRDVTERRLWERRTQDALTALVGMAKALVQMPESETLTGEPAPDVPHALASRLAELACSVLGCRHISIATGDPKRRALEPIAASGMSPAEARAWWTQITPRYAQGEAATTAVLTLLTARDPARDAGTRVLVAPLRVSDHVIGYLGITYGDERRDYTDDEIALANAVSTLVALMLEYERLLRDRAEARASALALREANRRMDEFLGVASHELRTPLTVAKGNLQLAAYRVEEMVRDGLPIGPDPTTSVTLLTMLEKADRHMDRLTRLVNDLVDVSRILTNKLELRFTACDLLEVVREAVQGQRPIAAPRQILLEEMPEGQVEADIDADRIEQVVTNYLTNALKYSPVDTPVHVGLTVDNAWARVWVRDEGLGLAAEEQDRIWERFYQGDSTKSNSGSPIGLGLGLHISRTIIERHQGQVGVTSAPGQGATFWFTLPLLHAEPPRTNVSEEATAGQRR